MTTPLKGTPEWRLWIAAIGVAADPPLERGQFVSGAKVYWPKLIELREALEECGVDWKMVKAAGEGVARSPQA